MRVRVGQRFQIVIACAVTMQLWALMPEDCLVLNMVELLATRCAAQ